MKYSQAARDTPAPSSGKAVRRVSCQTGHCHWTWYALTSGTYSVFDTRYTVATLRGICWSTVRQNQENQVR